MNSKVHIDARDVRSPAPFIQIEAAFRDIPVGETVTVSADDPLFPTDLNLWCESTGHHLVGLEVVGAWFVAVIRRKK